MKKEKVVICPHCSNETVQNILYKYTGYETAYDDNGLRVGQLKIYYTLTKCITCEKISLFANWELGDDILNLYDAIVLYPGTKIIPDNVPSEIKDTYIEAKKVLNSSPTAFSILMRKAIELLCISQGIKEINLKKMLKELEDKNIIPQKLSEMTDVIRIIGNISAHEKPNKIGKEEALIIDDFFNVIIEYLYIAPNKLKNIQTKLIELKKT